jgi:hypothetical protein
MPEAVADFAVRAAMPTEPSGELTQETGVARGPDQKVAELEVSRPPDAAGSDAEPSGLLVDLQPELVKKVASNVHLEDKAHCLDCGQLCRIFSFNLVLDLKQTFNKHNVLHFVYAAAPHRDKDIFVYRDSE